MDRTIPTAIVVVVVLGLLALMRRSWHLRSKRDASLEAGYPLPPAPTRELASVPAFYVATTPRDLPLERLLIRGLGFRARAKLTVTESGIILALAGEDAVFIPAQAIEFLTKATWAIDRVVEPGGLLLLGWRLSQSHTTSQSKTAEIKSIDSYFRIPDPADLDRVNKGIRAIAPRSVGTTGLDESEV